MIDITPEDEILKAAISKYGKNVSHGPNASFTGFTDRLASNGPVYPHSLFVKRQNNVKPGGTNGWIPQSRRWNGPKQRMKSFYISPN
jgi:hypothetical protein